jgi:hypothetical protein
MSVLAVSFAAAAAFPALSETLQVIAWLPSPLTGNVHDALRSAGETAAAVGGGNCLGDRRGDVPAVRTVNGVTDREGRRDGVDGDGVARHLRLVASHVGDVAQHLVAAVGVDGERPRSFGGASGERGCAPRDTAGRCARKPAAAIGGCNVLGDRRGTFQPFAPSAVWVTVSEGATVYG